MPRPSNAQVFLGIFIIWQLFFLFAANFLGLIKSFQPNLKEKPLVERLEKILKPKGNLLAFFHTKEAGPESLYSRHHIVKRDVLELEPITSQGFRLQRIFNNRHIENLFKDFASRKFFLGRDNIREVLMVR